MGNFDVSPNTLTGCGERGSHLRIPLFVGKHGCFFLGISSCHNLFSAFTIRLDRCLHLCSRTQRESPRTQREPPYTQCEPNASRWNIGRVGSPRVGAHIGHVHFIFFVSISFTLGSQRERNSRWNMGLTSALIRKLRLGF